MKKQPFWINFRRRKPTLADQLTPIEKQAQLGRRELDLRSFRTLPQRREAALLQAFGEHTQTRSVPQKHLGPDPITADEEEQIAARRIPPEVLSHDRTQTVIALA